MTTTLLLRSYRSISAGERQVNNLRGFSLMKYYLTKGS
jgi:hypothetical protein